MPTRRTELHAFPQQVGNAGMARAPSVQAGEAAAAVKGAAADRAAAADKAAASSAEVYRT